MAGISGGCGLRKVLDCKLGAESLRATTTPCHAKATVTPNERLLYHGTIPQATPDAEAGRDRVDFPGTHRATVTRFFETLGRFSSIQRER